MTSPSQPEIERLERDRAELVGEREALLRGARHPVVAAAPVFVSLFVPLFALFAFLVRNVVGRAYGAARLAALLPAGVAAWKVFERRERVEAERAEALEVLRKRIRAVDRELEALGIVPPRP